MLAMTLLVALTGCASVQRHPSVAEINNIPVDCSNKQFFITHLDNMVTVGKPIYYTQEMHDARISAIKTKIWNIRYTCQRM